MIFIEISPGRVVRLRDLRVDPKIIQGLRDDSERKRALKEHTKRIRNHERSRKRHE
jgi:hypothetical protein